MHRKKRSFCEVWTQTRRDCTEGRPMGQVRVLLRTGKPGTMPLRWCRVALQEMDDVR